MKSEPDVFGIDHLAKSAQKTTSWEGVRNYQARNIMRDEMKIGDKAIFYHSNAKPPGAAGVVEVVKEAHPDHTALDPDSNYFSTKASKDKNPWVMVEVKLRQKFDKLVSLPDMRNNSKLSEMMLLKKGMRLSIQPLKKQEFDEILKMAEESGSDQ